MPELTEPSAEESVPTTGTVEWFDAEQGMGEVHPDDGSLPCIVRSEDLRACGVATLAPGDRLRFQVRDKVGERTATDLALLRALQRWENEGGAPSADAPGE